MSKNAFHLRKLLICALFLSITLILKTFFTLQIPLFGENGMRIGVAGVFTALPAILFGPIYGAAVSALADVLGYLLKPTGAFMPLMTLVVLLGGIARGLLWLFFRNKRALSLRIAVGCIIAIVAIIAIANFAFLNQDGIGPGLYDNGTDIDTRNMHAVSKLLIMRTQGASDPAASLNGYIVTLTTGLIGFCGFCLLLLLLDYLLSKRKDAAGDRGSVLGLLLTMVLSGLLVTTLNTIILREILYPSWKLLPFMVVYIPRVIEELVSACINTYFISLLYGFLLRQRGLQQVIQR